MNRYKLRRYITFMGGIMVTAILVGVYAYAWYAYYSELIRFEPFYKKGNWLVLFIYAILIYLFFKLYGGYKFGMLTTTNIIYSESIALVIANVITFFQISLIARWWVNPWFMIIITAIQVSLIILFCIFMNTVYYALYPPRKMILLYGSVLASSLMDKMHNRKEKYMICETVDVNTIEFEEICKRMDKYGSVVICDVKPGMRSRILKYCFDNNKRAYMTPKIVDILVRGADDVTIFDTPLLICRNRGLNFEQRTIKRCVDIIISFIGIVLSSPFMLITAICIKAYDGGHVFYKQKRSTIDGKEFKIIKFRSMIENAENDGKARLAKENDNRITPVGSVIRRYRLDELPQLFNILRGDMSVVGPRPERPEIIEKYVKEMPEFKYRLKVKAGLTGYAQVVGKYNTTAYDKLKMDLMYIENYSLFMDIKLILMTLKIMFIKESTEGIKN